MKFLISLLALAVAADAARLGRPRLTRTPAMGECPPKPATVLELDAAAVSIASYRGGLKGGPQVA